MTETYHQTRQQLENYFDRTAAKTWARLTSDAPVSRIRETVRKGRDRMRSNLLCHLPDDLRGARILDAGCGVGQMSAALAQRGADVVAVDLSPTLLKVAQDRTPAPLAGKIRYITGDMLQVDVGPFDYVVAMDSLIHYRPQDIAQALNWLTARTGVAIVFTIAPKTVLLTMMHRTGKLFPRSDRSPAIVPVSIAELDDCLRQRFKQHHGIGNWQLNPGERVDSGFYISQAMELHR